MSALHFLWKNNLWILGPITSVALGLTVGWLTGLSGPDSTVIAAVLPVIISGAAAVIVLKLKNGKDSEHLARLCVLALLFSGSLYLGTTIGVFDRDRDAREALFGEIDTRQEYWEKRLPKLDIYLQACSEIEARVNHFREHEGLSPLKSEVFCKL